MKHIKLFCIVIIILTLTACSSQSKIDVNGYIEQINFTDLTSLCIDDFLLTSKGDELVYKAIKENVLISVYCKWNGEITGITLTSKKRTDFFDKLCIDSISAFTNSTQAEKEYNKAIAVGSIVFSKYSVSYIDYTVGKTLLINYAEDKINTNENPTLKGYISEDEISRPALE